MDPLGKLSEAASRQNVTRDEFPTFKIKVRKGNTYSYMLPILIYMEAHLPRSVQDSIYYVWLKQIRTPVL